MLVKNIGLKYGPEKKFQIFWKLNTIFVKIYGNLSEIYYLNILNQKEIIIQWANKIRIINFFNESEFQIMECDTLVSVLLLILDFNK